MKPRDFTLLLVDDSADLREALSAVLEFEGFKVTTAVNGADAIRQLGSDQLDPARVCLLLDMYMPGLDGASTIARLKGDPRTADVPVILMTAEHRDDRHPRADGVLLKPFDMKMLVPTIEGVLRPRIEARA